MKCNRVCKENTNLLWQKIELRVSEEKSGVLLFVVTLCLLTSMCVKGSQSTSGYQNANFGSTKNSACGFKKLDERKDLNCGRNLSITDVCNPCGEKCTDQCCDNWKCPFSCAGNNSLLEGQLLTRGENSSLDSTKCHSTWKFSSVDLIPVELNDYAIYYAIGIPAMIIDVAVVATYIARLSKNEILPNKNLCDFDSTKTSFASFCKIGRLMSTITFSLLDSIFDALYFIRLKTEPRLIHVPAYVHVIQGGLLYTCESFQVFLYTTDVPKLADFTHNNSKF